MSATTIRIEDKTIRAAGLNLRYLEAGAGHPVIFLHGGSLGSSADVFLRNMPAFAKAGFRALAFDQPGFGLSDVPDDHSVGLRRKSVLAFMDALGLSAAGGRTSDLPVTTMSSRSIRARPSCKGAAVLPATGSNTGNSAAAGALAAPLSLLR